ncbi:MAG: DUF5606 domain-containing protein [Bacteroidales bacterium]
MDLSKILTIAGKSGLFQVVSQTRNGLIVESLTDGKRQPVFATSRSSILEDISLFTDEGDVPLKDVLWKIHQQTEGQPVDNPKKDPGKATRLFEEVLPDYDRERVHFSDIRKVFGWYNILLEKGLITQPEEEKEEDEKSAEDQKSGEKTSGKEDSPDKKKEDGSGQK